MPSRRVRFASTDTFYSSPPPPLIGFSPSPPTSLLGPLTPPPLYAAAPLIPKGRYHASAAMKVQAHNLIALSPIPLLQYDVSLPPYPISSHRPGLSAAAFLEPAVDPPRLTLSLVTPHLPWTIPVRASNRRYVSVSDILSAIYRTLRVNATPAEFNALGTKKLMRRASAAYMRRCERLRGHSGYSHEKREGVKRVDFLMGYTTFQGIAPTGGAPDVWQITLS
ncbi:hypothetical protein C8F04DRAFT_1013840 [Mycena alexandri]|uniref:DUF6699 domain-containing protein n=1 Tax=Mycena alexandri TaxID=1745969 RepID=A0AAD6S619_9AGAR|nr:hypothetical protein C8F04DRAFT_1013840 [Mycena alexandri]